MAKSFEDLTILSICVDGKYYLLEKYPNHYLLQEWDDLHPVKKGKIIKQFVIDNEDQILFMNYVIELEEKPTKKSMFHKNYTSTGISNPNRSTSSYINKYKSILGNNY